MAGQNITTVSNILKDFYLPALRNQLTTEPSPFLEKIRKAPLTSDKIVASAPVGLNGGVAFGSDDISSTPEAGGQKYAQFELPTKNLYVNIEITDKAVKLASSSASAMVNALDEEIKGSYKAAEKSMSRAVFGDGEGILCDIKASVSAGGYIFTTNDASKLFEGMIVDIYANKSATASAAHGDSAATVGARIVSVDRKTGKVTVDKPLGACTTALTAADKTKVGTYGLVTLQKSYGNEFCGIAAVMNDSVTALYGVSKDDNEWIKPITVDCGGSITDNLIYDGVCAAYDFKNTKIDMILAGNTAFKKYQAYCRANSSVIVTSTMKFRGGASGYIVNVGSYEVVVVNERNIPENEMWGVCTDDWTLYHTDLDFADEAGATPFTLVNGTSKYRALLTLYGNVMCSNPGGCVRFTNC